MKPDYECEPKAPHYWAPGAIHGTHEHNDVTEWVIFKLDPESKPETGNIVPVILNPASGDPNGEPILGWFQAKAICDAHNRDLDLAIAASRQR